MRKPIYATTSLTTSGYEPVTYIGLALSSYTEYLLGAPTLAKEMQSRWDTREAAINKVLDLLEAAQQASKTIGLYFFITGRSKQARIRSQNPVYFAIDDARTMLKDRADLLGYGKPRRNSVGSRGRAAASPQAAARGYVVRALAPYLHNAPPGIRESFLSDILECAGHGTKATRQNVQAILRAQEL